MTIKRCRFRAKSKTRSSRKTRKPRRISFPRFFTPSFPFGTIPKTENSELKTSEFSLRHFGRTRRFSNSELSILHNAQNGKLGVENFGVFPLGIMIKVRGFPTPCFPFCTVLKTGSSELKTWEFDQTQGFPSQCFRFGV